MASQKKFPSHISLTLLLGAVFLGAFLIIYFIRPVNRFPTSSPTPTPDPIPSTWQTYSSESYHLTLRHPLDHFKFGAYPNLAFANIVHEQGFIMHPVAKPGSLYSALWTTLHVIDKKDPQIDSQNWFLSSVGVVPGDRSQIPNGDIFYAYDQSANPAHPLAAVNMGGSVLSRFTLNDHVHQFGLTGGGYLIYSSVIDFPSSRYFAILSLIIPAKKSAAPTDLQAQSVQAVNDYQLMTQSFTWQ